MFATYPLVSSAVKETPDTLLLITSAIPADHVYAVHPIGQDPIESFVSALATDKEIDQLWHIAWEILDRNNLDDDGELSIVVRNRE